MAGIFGRQFASVDIIPSTLTRPDGSNLPLCDPLSELCCKFMDGGAPASAFQDPILRVPCYLLS